MTFAFEAFGQTWSMRNDIRWLRQGGYASNDKWVLASCGDISIQGSPQSRAYRQVPPTLLRNDVPQALVRSKHLLHRNISVPVGRGVSQGMKQPVMPALLLDKGCQSYLVEG